MGSNKSSNINPHNDTLYLSLRVKLCSKLYLYCLYIVSVLWDRNFGPLELLQVSNVSLYLILNFGVQIFKKNVD